MMRSFIVTSENVVFLHPVLDCKSHPLHAGLLAFIAEKRRNTPIAVGVDENVRIVPLQFLASDLPKLVLSFGYFLHGCLRDLSLVRALVSSKVLA